jgi:hypothetical protein
MNAGSALTSFTGYEVVQQNPTIYSFAGRLENEDLNKTLTYTSGAVYPGQHIFGNPYTAAIDITQLEFGNQTEASVYLYNTGTYTDWLSSDGEGTPGSGPGQYTVSTKETAGDLGVPSQIPSMQGFLVKAMSSSTAATFDIPYYSVTKNTSKQRAPKSKQDVNSGKVVTRIDVKGERFSDRMWIFTDSRCTRQFDNGWDGRKLISSSETTQLFAMEEDGNYQINGVSNMNETYLGLQAGNDKTFKLTFNHQNLNYGYSKVYLIDLVENKTIDVTADGTEYEFTAETGSTTVKRFKIITQPTKVENTIGTENIKLFSTQEALFVENFTSQSGKIFLYNMAGVIVRVKSFNPNTITSVSTANLPSGTYVAKAITESETTSTQRLIIR